MTRSGVEDEGLIGCGVRLTAMGLKSQSNRIIDTAAVHARDRTDRRPDLPSIFRLVVLC